MIVQQKKPKKSKPEYLDSMDANRLLDELKMDLEKTRLEKTYVPLDVIAEVIVEALGNDAAALSIWINKKL